MLFAGVIYYRLAGFCVVGGHYFQCAIVSCTHTPLTRQPSSAPPPLLHKHTPSAHTLLILTQAIHALRCAAEEVGLLGVAQTQLGRELLKHVELVGVRVRVRVRVRDRDSG